jgi:hypothetical protein
MPERVAPTNIWEIPKESLPPAVRVYARKESGRYGFTKIAEDSNATMVQDSGSGDVYFTDSVVAGSLLLLIRGRIAVITMPTV